MTKTDEIISPHVQSIQEAFPGAEIGFRGSLARGTKGPHKGNAPFNPQDFDIDAFIVSDELASRFHRNTFFRSGQRVPELKPLTKEIDKALKEQLPGIRSEKFDFRIFTRAEFARKVGQDERVIIRAK